MGKSILIIGEDPDQIDFDAPGAPEGMTAQKVRDGLSGSRDRLVAAGHDAHILYTTGADVIADEMAGALDERDYDILVFGAGLRTLPPMAAQFETAINTAHRLAPNAALAFNSNPADSDEAALRFA